MAGGLTGPVSQSSAVKPTLPMGVITSYVIAVGAQNVQLAAAAAVVEVVIVVVVVVVVVVVAVVVVCFDLKTSIKNMWHRLDSIFSYRKLI
ncbi:hypothetical protein ElyMa_003896100 [Elysia marginata]|uniref:Uncharacterized protein n=1 Tax=Elysia marginata TaxID=1093978 RepID=A0AAV4FNM8_9GAST|nr:hypothetical protein ElyMa_003896100 [Elysia marginata]